MPHRLRRPLRHVAPLALAPLLVGLAACGGGSSSGSSGAASTPSSSAAAPSTSASSAAGSAGGATATTLKLGYFANVTHAPALVATGKGYLAKELGATKLTTQIFNAGPNAIEALNAGAIDAAYLGPSPAINAYIKSGGKALRIVSGAASGGAQLVVKPSITSIAQLKGTKLDTPQLGGTQDVALRAFLTSKGLKNSVTGSGGDVSIQSSDNAVALDLFKQGRIDGAWLPEPWSSRLVLDAGAKVLLDEKTLWPQGQWVTTNIVVTQDFLAKYPGTVAALVKANVESVDWINANKPAAQTLVNAQIDKLSGKPLSAAVIARAFTNLTITADPLAGTAQKQLQNGITAGTTKEGSIDGIYDLTYLNAALAASGGTKASAAGLGKE